MRRLVASMAWMLLVLSMMEGRAAAATLSVCPSGCPYLQIADAVASAHSGDTIQVAAGTYRGGFTVGVSVKIVGAGSGSTVISGGGPVITIGSFGATTEPTVSIDAVTITRGVTHTSPESIPFSGQPGVWALGGGIEIPPKVCSAGCFGGASVTIANSIITGNRAAPSAADDTGFAVAGGGGIDNYGTLSLSNTTVSNNQVGGRLASHAIGAGIVNRDTLSLTDSTVSGNRASTTGPNACNGNAVGGGIISYFALTMSGGAVTSNVADLSNSTKSADCGQAEGGGISVHGGTGTITGTTISGNQASTSSRYGDAFSVSGGIDVECDAIRLTLRDSVVSGNQVGAMTPAVSAVANPAGGGIGVCYPAKATISNTSITENSAEASAPAGVASADAGGIEITTGILSNSLVSGNRLVARSETGSARVHGAGVVHGNGTLQVSGTTISANTGMASGPSGEALGGGIWNGVFFPPPPNPRLSLVGTTVTNNGLSANPGITVHGGGLYTTFPVSITNSTISGNSPDNCFGTTC
jgi:hypothetical protein